jgi:nitrite reductase/ring-hydroxylating ferredoxin subunit
MSQKQPQKQTPKLLPVTTDAPEPDRVVFQLDRRGFCAMALGCAAAATLAACTDPRGLETGPITDEPPPDPGTPDARQSGGDGEGEGGDDIDAGSHPGADAHSGADARPAPDAAPTPDASTTGPTCSTSFQDAGAPSSFVSGTAVYFRSMNLFVMRDSGGLYAVSSICTHEGATLTQRSTQFYCPRHGATFDLNGNVRSGPVSRGLVHYAMCVMSTGHVGVNPSQQTSQSTRLSV